MYVLDTNIYVRAFRNADDAEALAMHYARHLSRTVFSAVVAHELATGANDRRKSSELREKIIAPFAARGRISIPTFASWLHAGEICGAMLRERTYRGKAAQKGFFNDVLLAVSCRAEGHVLLTWNIADFAIIRKFVRFEYAAPWA